MESVLRQKIQDFEVILVDDGSTDGSAALCDYYAEKDARVTVLHRENAGAAAARNVGIAKAEGNYLCFVDSDDYLSEFYLDKALEAAKRYAADIVIFDYVFVDEKEMALHYYHAGLEPDRILTLETCPVLLNTSPSPCNKLYRKQFFERQNLLYPEGCLYEDLALIPKLFCGANTVYIQTEPLYFYVIHKGSTMRMSVPDNRRRYENRIFAVNSVKEFYAAAGLEDTLKENLEFFAIYHIYLMLSLETIAEDYKSIYLQKYREYIRQEYPGYQKNKYIPLLLTKKERIKMKLLNGKHYKMIVWLGKLKGVLH